MKTAMTRALFVFVLVTASRALAAEPTAEEILKKYDHVMGPGAFEAVSAMTAHREDDSERTYKMRILRGDVERMRIWFQEPASVKGQEMLRNGDNLWVYLPNLKRATRLANRESFQGGDFNNADVLRVNYSVDYTGTVVPSDLPETYCVELKAKNRETAYAAIKLWVRQSDLLPTKGQYFGDSGKLLRSAEFTEYKEFSKGYWRPALIHMKNEQTPARWSEMRTESIKLNVEVVPQRFTQTDLGR